MSDSRTRDLFAALSLANLSLIELWNGLLNYTPAESFFFAQAPSRAAYAAALGNVLLIGAAFFALIQLARWIDIRFGSGGFVFGSVPILILISLPAAKAIVRLLPARDPRLGPFGSAAILGLLVLASALVTRRRFPRFIASLLVTIFPLIPIEALLAISRFQGDRTGSFASHPLAPLAASSARPKIVWLIFDELDYRLAFPGRPAGLELPALDRLRSESLFAVNALSPAGDTLHSIPSLLSGRKFAAVEPKSARTLLVDGQPIDRIPTIFSSVRAMGGNAAVVGWYLPYCRLFSTFLASCSAHEFESPVGKTTGNFSVAILRQQQSLLEYGYLSPFSHSLGAGHRERMIDSMREEARRSLLDPSLNLVFLHLPIPHAPHFYDRRTRTFTERGAGAAGYPDSLALADTVLADFRTVMTAAGIWDTSTILVSSDHMDRAAAEFDGKSDPRIPFLLKLAGQTSPVTYAEPLHTIVTKPLLEAIFEGEIVTPADAVHWLNASSSN